VTPTTATVTATINPDGLPTSYYLQYGSEDYGKETLPQTLPAGITPQTESITLTGLEPGAGYHYRLVATNNNNGTTQTAYGEDATVTTTATPPILTGLTAIGVTESTATITATLQPEGLPTRYELELASTPGQLQPKASGQTASTATLNIQVTALTPATTYYYKLTATNPNGTIEPEGSFTTATPPPGPTLATLPPTIPYTPITQLNTKETEENKTKPSKPLTNQQKLTKALKACKKTKNKAKRTACEKQAHKKYPTKHKR
jgi:hypothetical protein